MLHRISAVNIYKFPLCLFSLCLYSISVFLTTKGLNRPSKQVNCCSIIAFIHPGHGIWLIYMKHTFFLVSFSVSWYIKLTMSLSYVYQGLIPYALAIMFFTQACIGNEESRDLVSTLLSKLTEKICPIFGSIIYSVCSVVLHHSSQHTESLLFFCWVLFSAY